MAIFIFGIRDEIFLINELFETNCLCLLEEEKASQKHRVHNNKNDDQGNR